VDYIYIYIYEVDHFAMDAKDELSWYLVPLLLGVPSIFLHP